MAVAMRIIDLSFTIRPHFRWLVEQARGLGRHVMDRCNLSVLLVPSQADLAEFLASHRVEIIASLPSYRASQTDAQRGDGELGRAHEDDAQRIHVTLRCR